MPGVRQHVVQAHAFPQGPVGKDASRAAGPSGRIVLEKQAAGEVPSRIPTAAARLLTCCRW
jgi:hypothetical protein